MSTLPQVSPWFFFFFFRAPVWMSHHRGTEEKLQLSAHQWIKESWSLKYTYLESWGQVVLEEPELDRSFGVLQHWQHHDPETGIKTNPPAQKNRLVATKNRGRKSIEGCQFSRILSCSPSAHVSEAHLRKRSYRWPEATEKMLITSSLGCFCSSTAPPPVNPLNCKPFFLGWLMDHLTWIILKAESSYWSCTWSEISRSQFHFLQSRHSAAPRLACLVSSGPDRNEF